MNADSALAVRRAEFLSEVIDAAPYRSRAAELVASGALDRAARIAELAHYLTDAAIREMEAECSARQRRAEPNDIRSLRSVAFAAIAYAIIQRLDQKGQR